MATKGKAGRPKGAGNKNIENLRREVEKLVTSNRDKLEEALEMMRMDSPKDFVGAYLKFMEFVLPKALHKVEHSIEENTLNKISIEIKTAHNGTESTSDESL